MRNPAATIYRLSNEHDATELYDRITGYRKERPAQDGIEGPLITSTEYVERTERGIEFCLEYDHVLKVRQRDQQEKVPVKETRYVTGRFCNNLGSDGFILMGEGHDIAVKPVAQMIEGDRDASVQLEIAPTTITKTVSIDSQDARYKIWENIDVFTNMASIQGKVKDSTYSQDFDEHGRPVWVMFDSQHLGETVGVSKQGFVVYGSEIEPADIESFYFNVVKEAIMSS